MSIFTRHLGHYCYNYSVGLEFELPAARRVCIMRKRLRDERPRKTPYNQHGVTYRRLHERRCSICLSGRRSEIEQAFLDWQTRDSISKEFGITTNSLSNHLCFFYRLYDQRSGNFQQLFQRIMNPQSRFRGILEGDIGIRSIMSSMEFLITLRENGGDLARCQKMLSKKGFPMAPRH